MTFDIVLFLASIFALIDCDNDDTTGKYDRDVSDWYDMISDFFRLGGDMEKLYRIARDAKAANNGYVRLSDTYNRIFYSGAKHHYRLSKAVLVNVRFQYWLKREELRNKANDLIGDTICE